MTYSIVARCAASGELGVAIQTGTDGVGRVCPWVLAGVGAATTQAHGRMSHGHGLLTMMRNGHSAQEALRAVVAADATPEIRQLGVIGRDGAGHAYTGSRCIRYAGAVQGPDFAAQANMMHGPGVPEAMASAFRTAQGPLRDRLLAALQAAEATGGDFRGQGSAAILVAGPELQPADWQDRRVDMRVDDDPQALTTLARIVARQRAREEVDALLANKDIQRVFTQIEDVVAGYPADQPHVDGVPSAVCGVGRGEQLVDPGLWPSGSNRREHMLEILGRIDGVERACA